MIDWSVMNSVGKRVRVNHAVEHATITLLTQRVGGVLLRGRSNRKGFYVMGDVTSEQIQVATDEALDRLRSGQHDLAIHPFCGTNLAVTGTLTGLAAATAARVNKRSSAYSSAILAALAAVVVSQPLGAMTQRYLTTSTDIRDLRVESIEENSLFGKPLHFVHTSQ